MEKETRIKQKLSLVPKKPGCYQMKNKDGIIIYVGKAKNLKNRLASYFRGNHTGKTARLVKEIEDFEYIIVGSETESLILELNLIKKYDPKYNILLRDDKTYPYIELTTEEVPRLLIVRNLSRKKNRKARLYGPYPNVSAARETVNLLNRIYPLRKCNTYNKKPCLYYHIGQCLGYCTKSFNKEKLKQMENEIVRFLNGDNSHVLEKLRKEMLEESEKLNFERAKELKELIEYIDITLAKQKVEIKDNIDRDIFGYYEDKGYLSIQVFFIRSCKIIERHSAILPIIESKEEELSRYIAKFYEKNFLLPKEILVPPSVNKELLTNYLNVPVRIPERGEKRKIVEMASKNAENALKEKFSLIERDENRTIMANEELQKALHLEKLDRIDLFDNSNLFGSFNVSGMVVFKNGKPAKNEYRKFKITTDKNDDYGTMKEVIYRRYFRMLKENLERPDLIIVDGGIGQIHVAREVLKSLNLSVPVAGLKKDDKHATESLLAENPIVEIKVDRKSNLFYYLERMQDEVHNYTIHYHRQIRSKGSLESTLDVIPGIGSKRKKALLKKFHSLNKIKEASIEQLNTILPETLAKEQLDYLKEKEE